MRFNFSQDIIWATERCENRQFQCVYVTFYGFRLHDIL